MTKRMLIDASHPEETRVAILDGNRLEAFDFESATRKQLKGNVYLARVTRVEPSLQACFVEYGGNRQGFLAFSEIHPDYYQIPIADREALLREDEDEEDHDDHEHAHPTADQAELANAENTETTADSNAELTAEQNLENTENAETAGEGEQTAPGETTGDAEIVSAPAPSPAPQQRHSGGSPDVETVGGDEAEEARQFRKLKFYRRYKIQEVIKRRQILLVQVVKEERGMKGAALTSYISLPGRYCVLMPNSARSGVSRKISNYQDRKRMKSLITSLEVPDGMAVILRTAGADRPKTDIKRDCDYLLKVWDEIRENTLKATAPELIYEEGNLVKRAIRDLYGRDIEQIYVEGDEGYKTAKNLMKVLTPSHSKRVQQYKDKSVGLFQKYQVENQIDSVHDNRVELPAGGYIIINQTEALVAIDVNSGRSTRERNIEETAIRTNLEAAEEIARQMRLRDLAGLIVIDFIDMENHRNKVEVERRFKEFVRKDRARMQIGRISHFGLLELTRQRLRPSILEGSSSKCPTCNGLGVVRSTESSALSIFRAIEEDIGRRRSSEIRVSMASHAALYLLNHKRAGLADLELRHNTKIILEFDESLVPPAHKIERVKAQDTDQDDDQDGNNPRHNHRHKHGRNERPENDPAPVEDDIEDSNDESDESDSTNETTQEKSADTRSNNDRQGNRGDRNNGGEGGGRERFRKRGRRRGRDRFRNRGERGERGDRNFAGRDGGRDGERNQDAQNQDRQNQGGQSQSGQNQNASPGGNSDSYNRPNNQDSYQDIGSQDMGAAEARHESPDFEDRQPNHNRGQSADRNQQSGDRQIDSAADDNVAMVTESPSNPKRGWWRRAGN